HAKRKQAQISTGEAPADKTFWTKSQGKEIRKALLDCLKTKASEVGLDDQQLRVLTNRINQLGQMPNADRIEAVFSDLGIELTEAEKGVLGNRNNALHGKRTLVGDADSTGVSGELERYDSLRMLVHRAVLTILQYNGPYYD